MTPDEVRRLQQAFDEAHELRGEAREAFVERFARDAPELAEELRALLAADREADRSVGGIVDASIRAFANSSQLRAGERIGAWSVLRPVGEGGMGTVYLVERDDGAYRQQAALKLASARMRGVAALSRFRAERQILANLNHPNIATLIDGGVVQNELPYLVMEYVAGRPIDRFCDEKQFPIGERLRLFLRLCDAVDYAHRSLVIHRDIKPGNVLVTDDGDPKLLDFGIAKLLGDAPDGLTLIETREDLRAMTPEYASPEQVRGQPVTVATDVYALGVLLYRLLVGRSPYAGELTSSREVENAILDTEPTRPSAAVERAGDEQAPSASEISESRGLSVEELRGRLKGDLDRIVLECLHKEPERRYASVRDLARDIERYLRHEPISARGNDWRYRAGKFARRNIRELTVAGLALVAVAGTVTAYTIQLGRERDRAELAAVRSDQVASFLTDIFVGANPESQPGETVTAVELLRQGEQQIARLPDDVSKARLLRVMASSYRGLGDMEKAASLAEQSIAILREHGTSEPLELAESLQLLGTVREGQYDLKLAEPLLEEALSIARSHLAPDDSRLSSYLRSMAGQYTRAQRYDDAIAAFDEALAVKRRAGEFGDGQTSDILGALAIAYDYRRDYPRAIATNEEAWRISERELGPLDANTVMIIGNHGLFHARAGHYAKAARLTQEALRRGSKLWGADAPQLDLYRVSLGQQAAYIGDMALSREQLALARRAVLKRSGRESRNYVGFLIAYSALLSGMGEIEQGNELAEEGYRLGMKLFGPEGEMTLMHLLHLGYYDRITGRLDEAERKTRIVLANSDHASQTTQARARIQLARVLSARGQSEAADEILQRVLTELEQAAGKNSMALSATLSALSANYVAAGDGPRALATAARLLAIVENGVPPASYRTANAQIYYASALIANGRGREARPYLAKALANLESNFGPDNYRIRTAKDLLAQVDRTT